LRCQKTCYTVLDIDQGEYATALNAKLHPLQLSKIGEKDIEEKGRGTKRKASTSTHEADSSTAHNTHILSQLLTKSINPSSKVSIFASRSFYGGDVTRESGRELSIVKTAGLATMRT